MRKIITIVTIIIITILMLTSCNVNVGPGTYTFTDVHISDGVNSGHAHIKSWKNDNVGIEVNTEEYGSLFLSEGTYILYNGKCPICGED